MYVADVAGRSVRHESRARGPCGRCSISRPASPARPSSVSTSPSASRPGTSPTLRPARRGADAAPSSRGSRRPWRPRACSTSWALPPIGASRHRSSVWVPEKEHFAHTATGHRCCVESTNACVASRCSSSAASQERWGPAHARCGWSSASCCRTIGASASGPFDGTLETVLGERRVVIAEMYPAIAYTAALGADLPHVRIPIGKTRRDERVAALRALSSAVWVARHDVTLGDLEAADHNEDDFDALMFAAAALRCVVEERSLAEEADAVAEGGMLLASLIATHDGSRDASQQPLFAPRPQPRPAVAPRGISCPIAGCGHVFAAGRGGWDGHVGSLRMHPAWHPTITEPEERRARFRAEFATWFS